MRSGWYQLAFERDLRAPLSGVDAGPVPLIAVRGNGGKGDVRVFSATCPHMGAHLAEGGRLDGAAVICPFHSRRIGLGDDSGEIQCVREYRALAVGGGVFALIDEDGGGHDNGFAKILAELDQDHYFVPGFEADVAADCSLVIANGFDAEHFQPVHGVINRPRMTTGRTPEGAFYAESDFHVPPSPWQRGGDGDGDVTVPCVATAYGPGVVLSRMGGEHPYAVLTAATPRRDGRTNVRVSLVVPPDEEGQAPAREMLSYMVNQIRAGIDKDRVIWERIDMSYWRSRELDDPVLTAFRDFCREFPEIEDPRTT